ncbi:GntR family transcriptional regulator [Pediococcus pentosaceus]|uniref:GntR family transcriptional regulator n=1 Tax=Pediococcus pentosaceus TaxID=1255 RepID=UPI0018E1AF22|nr:GntR family transcriptional regulator [Pediococcus pentosaceus]MBF7104711.1 GntR family transcriptional regulator [Pediococcus pentosaceus]QQC60884.1 GntR family transcriptional regulator [Pediococcus pentosaceus]
MKKNYYLYEKIYRTIKQEISSGKYEIGDKIPTEKEVMSRFSVSRLTAKNAINLLAEENLVQRTPGKGTFVCKLPSQKVLVEQSSSKQSINSRVIGCVLSGFTDGYGSTLLKELVNAFEKEKYHLIIKLSNESQTKESTYINELLSLGVCGLIVLPVQAEYFNSTLLKIALSDTPLVLLDRKLTGIDVPFVGSNNSKGAYDATSELIQLGHKNISVVTNFSAKNSATTERIEGIRSAFSDNSLPIDESIWIPDLKLNYYNIDNTKALEADITKIQETITAHPEITSFFALDNLSTQLTYRALTKLGNKIPENYSLIGFDGALKTPLLPSFSRVIQDEKNIALKGAQLLIEKINNSNIDVHQHIIDTIFVNNGSIQAPRNRQ